MKRINGKVSKKKKNVHISGKFICLILVIFVAVGLIIISSTCSIKNINIVIDGKIEQELLTANVNNELENTQVKDTNKITYEEVKSLSGLSIGQNMFEKSKTEIINSLKTNPYVDDVKISKKINGILTIDLTQRKVAYLINYAGAYIYIDSRRICIRTKFRTC
ncbi:MAG: FtsQ-type POTRA domain-containing protein [Clostridia bacterium]|nr:FtsQ-type POTRA domain-containing protein [Clostridia bacterium]